MKITVAVSVYNTGGFLPEMMEKLMAQTFRDFEILLIDDGSTDGSSEECERQAAGREQVRVLHKENGGLASARNLGIEQAHGEYILFPDPDDWVEPDYLEKLVSAYEDPEVDLSICGHFLIKNGKQVIWNSRAKREVLDTDEALRLVMRQDSFMGYAWNKLYRMDLIRRGHLRFDEELRVIQDLPFAVRYISLCNKIVYDPVPLYHYSRDNGGATLFQEKLGKKELSGLKAYEKIAEMMHGSYPATEETAYASLSERALRFIGVYYRTGMNEPETFRFLHRTFLRYRRYFFRSALFTFKHKCSAAIAVLSPHVYYYLVRHFGYMREVREPS